MTESKFSTYHTIRAPILDFVDPYIVKLVDTTHPNVLWSDTELQVAIEDNNLECAKIYADMFTGDIDMEIIIAINRGYVDIAEALLPRITYSYSIMCAAIRYEHIKLMRLIWATKPTEYWYKFVSRDRWSEDISFAGRTIKYGDQPANILIREWFPKLIS